MGAGYVRQWMSPLQAIEHVRLVSGGTFEEAWGALVVPLREGVILSRFRGQEVGGVETAYLGGSGAVPSQWWYAASVFNDGSVEFDNDRLLRRPSRREIEIRRSDLLQIWPAPEVATGEEPPLGKLPPAERAAPPRPKSPAGGSRERPYWAEARAVGMQWLIDEGCPAPHDGGQALLERYIADWLGDHGHEPAESTIRRHVRQWIKERRAELDA